MEAPANGLTKERPAPVVAPAAPLLPRLSYDDVDDANALACVWGDWGIEGQFGLLRLRLCHPAALQTRDIPFAGVKLVWDGEPLTVWIPARALSAIAQIAQAGASMADMPESGRALLFEYVLDDILRQVEQAGHVVSIAEITNPSRNPRGRFGMHCLFGQLPPFPALIDGPYAFARRLITAAQQLPKPPLPLPDVPVLIRIPVGVTWLANSAFIALREGDTVMFDHSWLKERKAPVVIGESLVLTGSMLARGFRADTLRPVADIRERIAWLTDDHFPEGASMSDGDMTTLDQLEVKLVFEVGRFSMTLSDLNKLDAGHVFELNRQPDQAVDIYVLNRQVGSGELVMVGDRIGVRMTKIIR